MQTVSYGTIESINCEQTVSHQTIKSVNHERELCPKQTIKSINCKRPPLIYCCSMISTIVVITVNYAN
jgi:hypothetical protein